MNLQATCTNIIIGPHRSSAPRNAAAVVEDSRWHKFPLDRSHGQRTCPACRTQVDLKRSSGKLTNFEHVTACDPLPIRISRKQTDQIFGDRSEEDLIAAN
jgi:hypothetical protein